MTSTITPPDQERNHATVLANGQGERLSELDESVILELFKRHGAILFRGFSLDLKEFNAITSRFCSNFVFNESSGRKMITPDRWIAPLLNAALPAPPEPSLQRFIDILVLRYSETLIKLVDPEGLVHIFKNMGGSGQRDWCEGFLEGLRNFKKSWPAKSLGPNDRAMLRQIETIADDPRAATGAINALASWLSQRMSA